MDLPEAQAIIKDMDIDFRKWFELNPWKKSSKAKGEFFEWINKLLKAQTIIDAQIVQEMGAKGGCGSCGQPLFLGIIAEKIKGQYQWKILPNYANVYGIGIMPKESHTILRNESTS
jgi:hypothetical protein